MKDDAPRIFRSLEMRQGREGFDTIVVAAVASYGSLRSASAAQAREFGRLVVPAWDKITPETRRTLAASLSHARRVPRELIEKLLAAPLEISAPFLVSSPALTAEDLDTLAATGDARLARILAGRRSLTANDASPASGSTASLQLEEEPASPDTLPVEGVQAPVDVAPLLPVLPSPPLVPGHLVGAAAALPEKAGATARETLLRLARSGRSRPRVDAEPPTLAQLTAQATEGDADAFYASLGAALSATPERIRQIADDETGEFLSVALKALKAGPADAMTILMMLKPAIGLDVAAFEWMTRLYRALKVEECRQLLGLSRIAVAAPKLQPVSLDAEPLHRAQPRPQFGRRKSSPTAALRASDKA